MAEISLLSSLGYDHPAFAVRDLLEVIQTRTGIGFQEGSGASEQLAGTWWRVAESDPSAAPGRVRLFLGSPEEVVRVHAEVHGRAVQLGADLAAIEVNNDRIDRQQGNG